MTEKITISIPPGTKEELVALAHREGLNLSQFLANPAAQLTYVCRHSTGKLKIGVSNNPKLRAQKFGRIVAVIFDAAAEQQLLRGLTRAEPPEGIKDGKTEWVAEGLEEVTGLAEECGFVVLSVENGYGDGNIAPRRVRQPSGAPCRTCKIQLTVTAEEYYAIVAQAQAGAAHTSLSEFCRRAIMKEVPHV